jgi:hypothetical protein
MKRNLIAALAALQLAVAAPATLFAMHDHATDHQHVTAAADAYRPLPKPGAKIPLDPEHYFVYGFDKQPKLGTCVMRVEVFSRDGKRDTSYVIKGDADMPSMRGAHSNGEQHFVISAKGVYLMPVRLVMPGDWEVRLSFSDKGKTVLRGAYLFDL